MRTERLILRPFEEGDLDILHRLYGDAEVMHYTPFDPESLRQSHATETAQALIAYGFDVLGLREVYGLCHPDNAASRCVMEKCGMTLHEWRKEYVEYKKNGRRFLQDELEYVLARPSCSAVVK